MLQLGSLGLGLLLLLLVGVTGVSVIANAPIAGLIISVAVFMIAVRVVPPRAVIVAPPEPVKPDVIDEPAETASVVAPAARRFVFKEDRPVPMHANAFEAGHDHRSLEGVVLVVFALWIGFSILYDAFEFAFSRS